MAVRLINLLCWFILIPSARANPPFIKIILFFSPEGVTNRRNPVLIIRQMRHGLMLINKPAGIIACYIGCESKAASCAKQGR